MSDYRVQLDVFTGPLDLLLFLIRRDEVDILDIPIARITEEYVRQVHALEHLDPDAASEFLVMAATLVELKSRMLLPTPPIEDLEDSDDPRAPLVRQLLEYKRFKDAARALGTAADDRAKKYARVPVDLPKELQGVELEEVQVWDLLAAFGKVMTAIGRGPQQQEIRYDEVPIELHAAEIIAILEREGPTTFEALLDGHAGLAEGAAETASGATARATQEACSADELSGADTLRRVDRAHIVGRFLALLELIRAHRIRAEQERICGTIYLFLLVEVPEEEGVEGLAAEGPGEGPQGSRDQVIDGPILAPTGEEGIRTPSAGEGPIKTPSASEGPVEIPAARDEPPAPPTADHPNTATPPENTRD